jgi:hypothetical protein
MWPIPATAQPVSPPQATSDRPETGPLSGYMDFQFNNPVDDPVAPAVLDFQRFVLLFSHRFSERLRFVGELELEHAFVEGLEEGGELELEQAYVDMLASQAFNVRAGMMLVPIGIINERHEPPVYHGVDRPFVDTVIIPTTWFEAGAGVHGAFGNGFRYRGYVMAPLDASEFTAAEGLRGGSQHGSEAQVPNPAVTGRIEYVGLRGLQAGVSFWYGDNLSPLNVETSTGVIEADARFSRDRLEVRGEYAHIFNSGMGALNESLARLTGIDPNIAEELRGFYLEGSYRILPREFPHDAAVFARYENFDTQYKMPDGWVKLPEFDRDAWVVGATYWLDPDVAVKMDYTHVQNQSEVIPAPRSFNLGLGWWF